MHRTTAFSLPECLRPPSNEHTKNPPWVDTDPPIPDSEPPRKRNRNGKDKYRDTSEASSSSKTVECSTALRDSITASSHRALGTGWASLPPRKKLTEGEEEVLSHLYYPHKKTTSVFPKDLQSPFPHWSYTPNFDVEASTITSLQV